MITSDILFEQYAKIKNEIAILKVQSDGCAEQIRIVMTRENMATYKTTVGTFSLAERPTWKYSSVVAAAKEALENLQTKEIQAGVAIVTNTPYVKFLPAKQ